MAEDIKSHNPNRRNFLTSKEDVEKHLRYDPETGLFFWRDIDRGTRDDGRAGTTLNTGYIHVRVNGRTWLAHRLAWFVTHGEIPDCDIDHINGDKADNRIINLRVATRSENVWNQRKARNNTSGFKGVSWHRGKGKFQAQIRCRGVSFHLGFFSTAEEAHAVYCEAAIRHHGKFARFQ